MSAGTTANALFRSYNAFANATGFWKNSESLCCRCRKWVESCILVNRIVRQLASFTLTNNL